MIAASNGTKLFFCSTPQDEEPADAATYQALTWIECAEVESIGTFGDTSEEITFTALGDGRTRRFKGARDAGSMDVVMGLKSGDAGQLALIAAEKTIHDFAVRLQLNDAPPGGTPSERFFIAKVGGASEDVGPSGNVLKLNASFWIQSAVTRVAAASA